MKLLKHKEERQCTGVSDYPCFLIPAPICCPLNLIHRQSVQDWVEEASLGILPTRPEMKNKLCVLGNCFYWKKTFQVGRNRNMIGIFIPNNNSQKTWRCTSLGYCFAGPWSTGQVPVSICQDLSAVIRSPNKKRHSFAQELESWTDNDPDSFSERLWYANSHLAAPILHQKTADNNHSPVNEK